MGVSTNDDDRRRRLLLVTKLGSFMKTSWRRSREILTADDDDEDGKGQNGEGGCLNKKRSALSVRFDDEVLVFPSRGSNDEEDESPTPSANDDDDERWYGKDDYIRFKKDVILSSLNCVNAKRRNKSRFFDDDEFETKGWSVRGIENACEMDASATKRRETDKKCLHKAIRDEQVRQKRTGSYPDVDKLRSASLLYTKGERARALARGGEYARRVHSSSNTRTTASPSSPVKNLFAGTNRNNKHRRDNNVTRE